MSHAATNWAFQQRGLKPAAKIVLLFLADRHNPDHGCFPSQGRLAHDCGMSRASVNNQLDRLERAGMIQREKRMDEKTRRQMSTRYILGFEEKFAQNVESRVQNVDTEAVSKKQPDPCPENSESRVQNLDTNLVREPLREPVNARARVCEISFLEFWKVWPNQDAMAAAERAWKKLSPEQRQAAIDAAATWFAAWVRRNPASSPILPASYLAGKRWADKGVSESNPQEKMSDHRNETEKRAVENIKAGKAYLCRRLPHGLADYLVSENRVTADECKAVGLEVDA